MVFKNYFFKKSLKKVDFSLSPSLNSLYKRYQRGALDRKLEFKLSKKHFLHLVTSRCKYCGIKPFQKHKNATYMGIDRMDNKKGYTKYNVISCCKYCNYAKSTMGFVEFDNWLERVKEFQTIKNKIYEEVNMLAINNYYMSDYEKYLGKKLTVEEMYE